MQPSALLLAAAVLFAGCQQAQHPDPATARLLGSGAGAGGGAGGTPPSVQVRIAVDGAALAARFPGLARLVLTALPAGSAPVQVELPLVGGGSTLALPLGASTRFIFDGFDATGTWIAHGQSAAIVTGGIVVPVQMQPPPPGTPYTDPFTGLRTTGPTHALTVEVVDEATHLPVPGAAVVVGQAMLITDAYGQARLAALPADAAVHAFAPDGRAASVVGAIGRVRLPLPLVGRAQAFVKVNPPAGPTVDAYTLVDLYLTDGDRVAVAGHSLGDSTPRFVFPTLAPMAAPIGLTAMIENPNDATPRPDRGLLLATLSTPHAPSAPLKTAMPDPYAEPRHRGMAWHVLLPAPPGGLASMKTLTADLFAIQAGGAWEIASHRGSEITPAGECWTTVWDVGAPAYAARVRTSDGYAEVEARIRLPAPLPSPALWPPLMFPRAHPVVQQATATTIRWMDAPQPEAWDGFIVEIAQQGIVRWRIFGLVPPTGTLTLPAPPVQVPPPIQAGVQAEVRVETFAWDPSLGAIPAQDLEHWFRNTGRRARSPVFAFVP